MVHLSLSPRRMDQLAAAATLSGHSMSEEIKQRIEQSFAPEPAEPKEWR